MIDYLERKTLKAICAHHGAAARELIEHPAALIEWVHQSEQAKDGGQQPPFLLVSE